MIKRLSIAILSSLMIPAISFAGDISDVLDESNDIGRFNLGCDNALECVVSLDKVRSSHSDQVNYLFDTLRFVDAIYDEDSKTVHHRYFQIIDVTEKDEEEMTALMYHVDDTAVALYCADPVTRVALEDGVSFTYSIDVKKDGVVSDSGYTGMPIIAEHCEGVERLDYTFYDDVVKISKLDSKSALDYVTDEKIDFDKDVSVDKDMNVLDGGDEV